ncbi:putative neuropeptide F receptor [Fasciola hepatica]|uniref:Neuropeptide F receptor n=1 Tax=Fasciola hepatica TaxID=6192 RepID=A0A2H1CG45_FASHE|nr:putative neuropeptide F receptor [Fasciola hepatica]
MSNTSNETACDEVPLLAEFSAVYFPIHAYLALTVCIFGSATNFLNAIILVQKSMRSPTNALLTGIALVDSVTMIAYGMHTIYFYMLTSPDPDLYSHGSFTVKLLLIQNVLSISSHTISTVLLVELAAFRCWILYRATSQCSVSRGSRRHTTVSIPRVTQHRVVACGVIGAVLAGVLMGLPPFFIYTITLTNSTETETQPRRDFNGTQWTGNSSYPGLSKKQSYWFEVRPGAKLLESAHFVIYGCFVKILASILICALTSFILIAMEIARRRYTRLQNLSSKLIPQNSVTKCVAAEMAKPNVRRNAPINYGPYDQLSDDQNDKRKNAQPSTNGEMKSVDRLGKKTRQSQRATIMLIVVVVSFVITEAPQGVFNTLVAVKGECFQTTVYVPLGDVLDLAVLLNSSINFILYCTMSQMFRANFARLVCRFCSCHCKRFLTRFNCGDNGTSSNSLNRASRNTSVLRRNRCDQLEHRIVSFQPVSLQPQHNPPLDGVGHETVDR